MNYNKEWNEPTSGVCTECGVVFGQTKDDEVCSECSSKELTSGYCPTCGSPFSQFSDDEVCSECEPYQKPRNANYKPFRMYARIKKGQK